MITPNSERQEAKDSREDLSGFNETEATFTNNDSLRAYYQKKYISGGYHDSHKVGSFDVSKAYHTARHQAALQLLELNQNDVVLDAACGDGKLSIEVARRAAFVFAVDIASAAFESAALAGHPNIKFFEANIETILISNHGAPSAVKEGTIDKIVSSETLEHVIDPTLAIGTFSKVLKPGGLLVVTYPTVNRTQMFEIESHLWGRKPEFNPEHIHQWSFDELCQHCDNFGLRLVRAKGIGLDLGPLSRLMDSDAKIAKVLSKLELSLDAWPRNSFYVAAAFWKSTDSLPPK